MIEETKILQQEIHTCIVNLVHSRLKRDKESEGKYLAYMESLLNKAEQHLQTIIDFEERVKDYLDDVKTMPYICCGQEVESTMIPYDYDGNDVIFITKCPICGEIKYCKE